MSGAPIPADTDGPLVFLSATEASGDLMGAGLMRALKALTGGRVRFAGLGGDRMAAEGLQPLFPIAELAVMGVVELLPQMRRLLRRVDQTAAAALAAQPDIIVTIDSWGFNTRVASRLVGRRGCPMVQFVAPKVWAWRQGRARRLARMVDHVLAQLPFEPAFFARYGLAASFVGHPIVESGADAGDGTAFRARHSIDPDAPLVALLPGSRRSEVTRLLPVLGAVVAGLTADRPGLRIVVPTLWTVAERVRAAAADWPGRPVVVEGDGEKYDAFAASDLAIAASGTVAVELALAALPTIVVYRVNPLTAWVVRRLVKVRFANLINIIADRPVVPELLQDACTPPRILSAAEALLDDEAARRAQGVAAQAIARTLGAGEEPPSLRAARQVLALAAGRDGGQAGTAIR